jgi:hypothetical protein
MVCIYIAYGVKLGTGKTGKRRNSEYKDEKYNLYGSGNLFFLLNDVLFL